MIGIVTPYKIANYGTKLQAYAMQQLMGHFDEAELLGFVPGTDSRPLAVLGKIYLKLSKKKPKREDSTIALKRKKRQDAIDAFDTNYRFGMEVRGNAAFRREIKKYSAVVCGSDQLWAPTNVLADYFTLTLVPDEINKISYAASFGISEVPAWMKKCYRNFLQRMGAISVREEQGRAIVRKVADRDAAVVLDPTLMLETAEWAALADKSTLDIGQKYVFCYFLGTNAAHRTFAMKLAEITGTRLVTIPHFRGWNAADVDFGDRQIYEAGPMDFLHLIQNAEYVCTDSFHGTVFSVLFRREVAVFERFKKDAGESTNSRIYTLLGSLGMQDALMQDESNPATFATENRDYTKVSERLTTLKRDSLTFLEKALGTEER